MNEEMSYFDYHLRACTSFGITFALSEEFLDSRKGEEHTRQCALLVVLKQTWVSFRVIHLAFVN